jgi:glycosyltransferase involved in cell wall biosynthesis
VIIVVNTRLLIHNRLDGIGRFTFETLSRITRKHADDHFVFLFDRPVHDEFIFSENVTPVKLFPPARRTWLFNWWLNHSVHGVLRDLKPDLFLSPDGFLPLRGNTKCLPVIHDLNFEHFPEDLPVHYSEWYRKKFPLFAAKATRIATVSEFSKQDIAQRYHIDPSNIDVVYNAAGDGFKPLSEAQIAEVRSKRSNGAPYFLYIGALHPRKNLVRLIEAYESFRNTSDTDIKLLITGGEFWKNEKLKGALAKMTFKDDVIFTGRVSDSEIYEITGAALALTYVPYFEGFGIPIVEAMSCGVPVVSGNTSSLPEVAGNAALYCDPFSVESIAEAMKKIAADSDLRNRLSALSIERASLFSWEKSADDLWNSIVKTVEQA